MATGPIQAEKPTLFQELGGMEGITGVTDAFLYELAENDKIVHFFEDSNLDRFREKFIEQICEISDGPCQYTGDTMVESHRGMNISDGDFNSLVQDFINAMKAENIAISAQNDLLSRLIQLYDEIIFQ